MSKIYDALQIAQGERLAAANKQKPQSPVQELSSGSIHELPSASVRELNEVTTISPSTLVKRETPYSLTKLYQDSELLVLAQNLAALLPNPEKNVIQFIGSREGEGTSTLIREFAMVAAQQSSKPVLLIEADRIRPHQYQAFGIETKPSLDQVLQEGKPLDGVISQVEKSNLFLATLSSDVHRSLTKRSFFGPSDMWKVVREQFSLILIDSSPVSVSADSLAICEMVDGIVLVVEAEKTRSVVANNVKQQILMREGNLLGVVFTKRKFHIPNFIYKFL